jgi:hypothetical protein
MYVIVTNKTVAAFSAGAAVSAVLVTTAADYVGITGMIVTCLAAIAAALVSIINAIRTPQKIAVVETKIDAVHGIVNSQRTEMVAKINNLEEVVRQLLKDRDDEARGKTLIQTAKDAASDVLHAAKDAASDVLHAAKDAASDLKAETLPPEPMH